MKAFENKIIYQIYPKSFLDTTGNGFGDMNGIRQKLAYIKELGVDYIWLSPCCKSPQYDNGYDISDYTQIDERFGTNEEYMKLLKEADEIGLKIMMDLVLNHTSHEHIWFQKALDNDSYYRDFYIWRDKPNALQSIFGGSAWEYEERSNQYYLHLFTKQQPDLNWDNPNVRNELYAMINAWIKKGVQGFRLDVIDLIGKQPDQMITAKGPKFYEYLKELHTQTFSNKILTVGECWGATIEDSKHMCNHQGLTQAFHFQHLCLSYDENKFEQYPLSLRKLCSCLETWQNEEDLIEAVVMNNHDQPRLLSLWLNDTMYRTYSAKLLITLFALTRGNLYIYQGEEIGMTNAHFMNIQDYRDIETLSTYNTLCNTYEQADVMEKISNVSRDNARIPMQWNDTKHAGFSSGIPWIQVGSNYKEVNVERDLQEKDGIYRYYQKILKFRKEHYDLLACPSKYQSDETIVEMDRGKVHVVANFTSKKIKYNKPTHVEMKNYECEDRAYMRPYEVIMWIDEEG